MIKSPKASLGYMARLSQEKKKGGGGGGENNPNSSNQCIFLKKNDNRPAQQL